MAGTDIKLTPEELIAQSTELTSLQTEFESVFSQLTSTLNSMNDSWSATLAGNFAGKIQAAQKSFTSVANMLANGSSAARLSASTFASPGTVLAMLSGGDTSGLDSLSDLAGWISENGDQLGTLGNLVKSPDEMFEALSGMTGIDSDTTKDVLGKLLSGDYEGALKVAGDKGIETVAGWMSNGLDPSSWVGKLQEMTGSTLGLDLGLDKLESSYYEHVAKGVLGNAVNIVKDQYSEGGGDPAYQLNQLTQFAWNLGPGGVIETAGDAAFDVVSKLPIVGDYYSDKGVTNFAGAVDSMIGDVQSIFTGSSDSHYYQDHGGIAQGIADGVMDIGSYLYHSVFK